MAAVTNGARAWAALLILRGLLASENVQQGGYVLFGSVPLFLSGLRTEVGDIDVFVGRDVWEQLRLDDRFEEQRPRADDPPFLVFPGSDNWVPIHVFYEWTSRDEWISVERCFEHAEDYGPLRAVSLEETLRIKQGAWEANRDSARHEKHAEDIARLQAYLATYTEDVARLQAHLAARLQAHRDT